MCCTMWFILLALATLFLRLICSRHDLKNFDDVICLPQHVKSQTGAKHLYQCKQVTLHCQVAATRLAKGQRLMDRRRPDLKYRQVGLHSWHVHTMSNLPLQGPLFTRLTSMTKCAPDDDCASRAQWLMRVTSHLDKQHKLLHSSCFHSLLHHGSHTACDSQEREKDLLKKTESFAGPHRVRPSLLRPIASAAGLALGSLASVLPKTASAAISGTLDVYA